LPRPRQTTSMQIGEIWLVQLADITGTETSGTRPVLVITLHSQTSLCTIIPLTSNPNASRFPNTYQISSSNINGLSVDSVAMIFQLRSLSFGRFLYKIGNLEQQHFARIKTLVKQYLGLSSI